MSVTSIKDLIPILREFRDRYGDKYGITEIGVFGSFARGDATEKSDIDIWVKTITPDPFKLVHAREHLENITQRHVDLIRLRDYMNSSLRKRIELEGMNVQ